MKTVVNWVAICLGIMLLWLPRADCFAKVSKNALGIGNSPYETAKRLSYVDHRMGPIEKKSGNHTHSYRVD